MRGALVALLLIAAVPGLADAECAPRPEKLCVLVNSPGPIIQGTILKAANSAGYEWVVRVDRSFRGNLKGQIVVSVTYGDGSGPASFLKPEEQYLFYLRPSLADGSPGLSATLGCGSSVALEHPAEGEVAFLARLGSRVADGHIFGELSRARPYPQPEIPYSGVRVTALSGTRQYSTHTSADGTFDIGGLPPGSYHLDADVRDTEFVETEEDPIELQPHGCAENDLDVQDNTVVRGRVAVPAGMRNRIRFVSAFTVDGTPAGGGFVDEHGRYEIHGLPPGDYVFGTGEILPRPDAPFVRTYAPATADLAQARRIHLTIGMTARDVDISMGPALPIKQVSVRLAHPPILEPRATLLVPGGGIALAVTPQADGTFTIPIVARGDAYLAISSTNGGCSPPTPAGDGMPTSLELELSADGCRQTDNLSRAHSLARAAPGRFLRLPVHVMLSDGRPAAGASVVLSSSGARTFFEAFHADRDGRLDLSVPGDDLFTIEISWSGTCPRRATWLVNTSGPIRMTRYVRGAPVDWSTIPPIGGPLEAVLSGPDCR